MPIIPDAGGSQVQAQTGQLGDLAGPRLKKQTTSGDAVCVKSLCSISRTAKKRVLGTNRRFLSELVSQQLASSRVTLGSPVTFRICFFCTGEISALPHRCLQEQGKWVQSGGVRGRSPWSLLDHGRRRFPPRPRYRLGEPSSGPRKSMKEATLQLPSVSSCFLHKSKARRAEPRTPASRGLGGRGGNQRSLSGSGKSLDLVVSLFSHLKDD